MDLTPEQREQYLAARNRALKIVQDAEAEGRNLTDGEKQELNAELKTCQELTAQTKALAHQSTRAGV